MKHVRLFALLSMSWALASCGNGTGNAVDATDAQETAAGGTQTFVVAPGADLKWEGYKSFVEWRHNGVIKIAEGQLSAENGELKSGRFVIDMKSIQPLDMEPTNEKYNDLVGHLMSPDFFLVDSFPTATFEITAIEPASDAAGNTHKMSGNLTLRGVTKNISFPVKVHAMEGGMHLTAPEFTIDRTQWGVIYGANDGKMTLTDDLKNKLIDNNIKFSFDFMTAPQA
ncbi:YceI family protein [bacterium]|nr:YceI family protein [bacterium]